MDPRAASPHANDTGKPLKPPGPHLLAMEWGAPLEAITAAALWPLLMQGAKGDGHSVLVIPGLGAPDASTRMLRRFLKQRGYDPHRWELGANFGPRPGVLEACLKRLRDLNQRSGRTVSLVGWSLGGVYARELAKRMPDAVRVVVTLGTPFTGDPKATNAWRVYELLSGKKTGDHSGFGRLADAPPVPTTSIFSRTDGIVNWRCSIQEPSADTRTENIEVRGTHVGMGANAAVLLAVADRLAQPEGAWQPFERSGARQWIYGDPARAR